MESQQKRIVIATSATAGFALVAGLLGASAAVSPNAAPAAQVSPHAAPVRVNAVANRGYDRKPCPLIECPHPYVRPTPTPTVAPVVPTAEASKPKPTATKKPATKPAPQVNAGGGCAPSVKLPQNVVDVVHKYLSGCDADALLWIISHESGGNVHAVNKSSGAYGIPQALPGSKMASAGSDWRDSADTQIRWMLSYVNSRYGGPAKAYAFWRAHSWY